MSKGSHFHTNETKYKALGAYGYQTFQKRHKHFGCKSNVAEVRFFKISFRIIPGHKKIHKFYVCMYKTVNKSALSKSICIKGNGFFKESSLKCIYHT